MKLRKKPVPENKEAVKAYNKRVIRCRIGAGLICVTVFAAGVFLLLRIMANRSFAADYERGIYSEETVSRMTVLNVPDGAVPYYQMGEVAFQEGRMQDAESLFRQALAEQGSHGLTGDRVCDIRVNLARAIVFRIEIAKLKNEDDVQKAIDLCYAAREVLTEDGCADEHVVPRPEPVLDEAGYPVLDEYGNYVFTEPSPEEIAALPVGHDAEAEQLKNEIDNLIYFLENMQGLMGGGPNDDGDDPGPGSPGSGGDNPTDNPGPIPGELKDARKEAMKKLEEEKQKNQNPNNPGGSSLGSGRPEIYW